MPSRNKERQNEVARASYHRRKHLDSFKARRRAWVEKNKEKIRAYQKEYRTNRRQEQPEMVKAYHRQYIKRWRASNPDKTKLYQQRWYASHAEYSAARTRRWERENPERHKQYKNDPDRRRSQNHKRRSRIVSSETKWSKDDIAELKKRQRGHCYWCRKKLDDKYEIDHVWPLVKGGSNGKENIVISCKPCNRKKGAKTPIQFAGVLL